MEKNKNVHAFLGPHCNAYVETVTTLSVRTFYVHAVIQFFFIGVQILTWCTRLSIVTSAKLFHHRPRTSTTGEETELRITRTINNNHTNQ
jgi:hypothetical protein